MAQRKFRVEFRYWTGRKPEIVEASTHSKAKARVCYDLMDYGISFKEALGYIKSCKLTETN